MLRSRMVGLRKKSESSLIDDASGIRHGGGDRCSVDEDEERWTVEVDRYSCAHEGNRRDGEPKWGRGKSGKASSGSWLNRERRIQQY